MSLLKSLNKSLDIVSFMKTITRTGKIILIFIRYYWPSWKKYGYNTEHTLDNLPIVYHLVEKSMDLSFKTNWEIWDVGGILCNQVSLGKEKLTEKSEKLWK